MAFLQSLILFEKSLLDEIYYDAIGSLLNKFTRYLLSYIAFTHLTNFLKRIVFDKQEISFG